VERLREHHKGRGRGGAARPVRTITAASRPADGACELHGGPFGYPLIQVQMESGLTSNSRAGWRGLRSRHRHAIPPAGRRREFLLFLLCKSRRLGHLAAPFTPSRCSFEIPASACALSRGLPFREMGDGDGWTRRRKRRLAPRLVRPAPPAAEAIAGEGLAVTVVEGRHPVPAHLQSPWRARRMRLPPPTSACTAPQDCRGQQACSAKHCVLTSASEMPPARAAETC